MPRLPRVHVNGAVYLVTSKAPPGQQIFKERADYEMYMDLLAKYKREHQFRLFAYCLLPDRLHLLIEPMGAVGISKIMHDLNSNYTKHSNSRYGRRGPLFESRFKSILAEKGAFLASLSRFVHRSPGDGMKDHPYSSYGAYTGGPQGPVPVSDEAGEIKNELKSKGIEDYAGYCTDAASAAELEKRVSRGALLGSEDFIAGVKEKIKEHTESLKETALERAPAPKPWMRALAAVLLVLSFGSMAYLYVAKIKLENKYEMLLQTKEIEFYERTSFENKSPLSLVALDGTEWRVETLSSVGVNAFGDTLRFDGGVLSSSHFGSQGFGPAPFRLESGANGVENWSATQSNSRGETLAWRGIWRGDALKGEATLTGPAGIKQTFTFFSVSGKYVEEAR